MFNSKDINFNFKILKSDEGEPLVSVGYIDGVNKAFMTARHYFELGDAFNEYLDYLYNSKKIPYNVIETYQKMNFDSSYLDINYIIDDGNIFCDLNFLHTDKKINTNFMDENFYMPYSYRFQLSTQEWKKAIKYFDDEINPFYNKSIQKEWHEKRTKNGSFVVSIDEDGVKIFEDDMYFIFKLNDIIPGDIEEER